MNNRGEGKINVERQKYDSLTSKNMRNVSDKVKVFENVIFSENANY